MTRTDFNEVKNVSDSVIFVENHDNRNDDRQVPARKTVTAALWPGGYHKRTYVYFSGVWRNFNKFERCRSIMEIWCHGDTISILVGNARFDIETSGNREFGIRFDEDRDEFCIWCKKDWSDDHPGRYRIIIERPFELITNYPSSYDKVEKKDHGDGGMATIIKPKSRGGMAKMIKQGKK
ncbi:uncharacterized protein LOC131324250 [Rhododendron vialii]|uniref:uncharacterized protein LOC131324250 n=1 Tax=Rhododendron vialii TaxID=182163 RepID=UPI0026605A08|nr:uncharacterized protein LOC131324250 [Rhododendron vialii]